MTTMIMMPTALRTPRMMAACMSMSMSMSMTMIITGMITMDMIMAGTRMTGTIITTGSGIIMCIRPPHSA